MSEPKGVPADTAEQVRAVLVETLLLDAAASDPLAGRTLDSVAIIQLLAALEDRFGLAIPPEEIRPENFASASDLAAMIGRLLPR